MDALSVEICSLPFFGPEELLPERIVDDAEDDVVAMFKADGYGAFGDAAREVGSAVDRVDDPDVVMVHISHILFFAEEA